MTEAGSFRRLQERERSSQARLDVQAQEVRLLQDLEDEPVFWRLVLEVLDKPGDEVGVEAHLGREETRGLPLEALSSHNGWKLVAQPLRHASRRPPIWRSPRPASGGSLPIQ